MKTRLHVISLFMVLFLLSCRENEVNTDAQAVQPQQQTIPSSNVYAGVVEEVIQGNTYTYIKVKETDTSSWIATSKRDVETDKKIMFRKTLPMNNFTSKEVNKTFETIYFVGSIGNESSLSGGQQDQQNPHGKPAAEIKDISIEPIEGGISIVELFSNRDAYANKVVRIKGQITKVNLSIMGKNWIHLQDGTGEVGSNDLLVTTQDVAAVGDTVIFEGTIALNRNFGAGYSYEILMEDAKRQ
jgi:sporulation protein YlmC with PRC-barrel domain